ncbi:hypothetical protein, partial [Micrococcus luteus]|uniref:hypothetical protein n=1 Tax=Micrococcus luteus TaxID=1270 RepID=UPI001C9302E3
MWRWREEWRGEGRKSGERGGWRRLCGECGRGGLRGVGGEVGGEIGGEMEGVVEEKMGWEGVRDWLREEGMGEGEGGG